MTDYFAVQLPPEQIRSISSIGLAHIGDAVYELLHIYFMNQTCSNVGPW